MKKRVVLFSVFLLLGIGLFVGVILQTGLGEMWRKLREFSLLHFFVFLGLSFLNFGLYTLRWHLIVKALHDKTINFGKLFLHRMSGFGLSYLTPSAQTGGEPLRILLLHHEGVSTRTATSSVVIDKGLELGALFLFIALGIVIALFDGSLPAELHVIMLVSLVGMFSLMFWVIFATIKRIGFFSSILRFFRLTKFKKVKSFEEKVIEVEEEIAHFYKKHVGTFWILVPISLVITSFLLLEHYLVARFMGVHMTFLQTFLVSTIPYVAFVIPIPGGLGILEGGHAAIFLALGISINAFVLVFIIRIRDLCFVLIGLRHASKQGLSMLRQAFQEGKKG